MTLSSSVTLILSDYLLMTETNKHHRVIASVETVCTYHWSSV